MNNPRHDTTHLHAALAALGWSPRNLADITSISERTVRRWATGHTPIPPNIAKWLALSVKLLVTDRPEHVWTGVQRIPPSAGYALDKGAMNDDPT